MGKWVQNAVVPGACFSNSSPLLFRSNPLISTLPWPFSRLQIMDWTWHRLCNFSIKKAYHTALPISPKRESLMKRTKIFLIILGAISLMLIQGAALAQVPVNYQWTAPTTGSPVDHYVIQHSVNGGTFTQIATSATNSYTLSASVGDTHQIRVAGVDAESRQGGYSLPSDAYTPDLGVPGQPGKPIIF